jgi:LysM repeat protein
MDRRSKLALRYFLLAIALFVGGYALAWFSEQPVFSKEVFPKHTEQPSSQPQASASPQAKDPGGEEASAKPGKQYTVQSGDTISAIASANGVSIEELAQYNGIPYPYNLTVDQIIVIPQK